jgi:uncharacterized membrane protein YhaH (DUF805 family)
LVNIVASGIDRVTDAAIGFSFVSVVVTLGLLIPSLAVAVRRLHDSGLSGWWLLAPVGAALLGVGFFVGGLAATLAGAFSANAPRALEAGIVLFGVGALLLLAALIVDLVLMLRPSTPGPNRFGPGPGPTFPYPPTGGYGYGPGYAPPPWPAGPPAAGTPAPPASNADGNVAGPV